MVAISRPSCFGAARNGPVDCVIRGEAAVRVRRPRLGATLLSCVSHVQGSGRARVPPPMADVQPLRTLRYDPAAVGSLERVIAPPYDVIDEELRARLVAQSPYNVV